MNSKFTKKIKVVVIMIAILVTSPFYHASASNELNEKQSISTMFSNSSTAIAVAKGYKQALKRPYNTPIDVNEELSSEDLNKITALHYEKDSPITFVDKDLAKLKGLVSLTYTVSDFNDLSGIEILNDHLKKLTLNSTAITDIGPVAGLENLAEFTILNTSLVTNAAIKSNRNFIKPLEKLNLERLYFLNANINDDHAQSISKITSLKYLLIIAGDVTDFEPFTHLTNLVDLDLAENNLQNLTGFYKLVNIKNFRANTDGDNVQNMNRFYDFSDITYPYTSTGNRINMLNLSKSSTILPLTVEYIKNQDNEYEPVYTFDLNKIKLPKASPGTPEFELFIETSPIVEKVDLGQNILYINKEKLESRLAFSETGEVIDMLIQLAYYRPVQDGNPLTSNYIYLYVDSLELKGELPPAKKVNVEFVYNNDTPNKVVQLDVNEILTQPIDPSHGGKSFAGWYTDSIFTNKWNFANPVTEDMTLYARWESPVITIKYDVIFNSNGGTNVDTVQVEANTKVQMPTDPVKEGYTFAGWYEDLNLTNKYDFETLINKTTHIYAKWNPVPVKYTVKFDTQGGTEIVDAVVLENTSLDQPSDPNKVGYKFIGWFTNLNDDLAYNFETLVNNNLTLFAKWEKVLNVFELSFDSTGGSFVPSQKVEENSFSYVPVAPHRPGFIFMGWYEEKECTTLHNFNEVMTSDKVVYAKWIEDNNHIPKEDTDDSINKDTDVLPEDLIDNASKDTNTDQLDERKNILPGTGISSNEQRLAVLVILMGIGLIRFTSKKKEI